MGEEEKERKNERKKKRMEERKKYKKVKYRDYDKKREKIPIQVGTFHLSFKVVC